jgi:Xaa-Pro aminopeptidase
LNRLDNLRKKLRADNLDCYLVTDVKNIYYLTGFLDISSAVLNMLIPSEGEPTLLVTSLSLEAAISQVRGCQVRSITLGEVMNDRLIKELKEMSPKLIGYDKLQLDLYLTLSKNFDAQLFDKSNVLANQRKVKDDDEVAAIQRACEMADAGMEAAIEAIRPGSKEYEIAAEAEYAMRKHGSLGVAFDTLVASGPRSAFPHGISTDREIREGEFVTVDLGATWKGYCSDLTRTVVAGRTTAKALDIKRRVKEAHDKVLDYVRSGVEAVRVDALARATLGPSFADYFIHGLGHGVGLDIHEAPTLSRTSKDVLEAGNVVTDEPGIYIHGYGGVRTEDTILVTMDGCKQLTRAPYP